MVAGLETTGADVGGGTTGLPSNENTQYIVGQSKSGMRISGCGDTFNSSSARAKGFYLLNVS